MKATEELIESFRSFALERLGRKDGDLSIDELYDCWRRENPDEEQAREDFARGPGLAPRHAARRARPAVRRLRPRVPHPPSHSGR